MLEFVSPLLLFAIAALFTPGPNNVLLMTSGIAFGFRRTIPHIAGVCFGFFVMLVAVSFGLGELFARWPGLQTGMKIIFIGYFVYLAWTLVGQRVAPATGGRSHPMTLLQAAAFQWINPKAWLIITGVISTYPRAERYIADVVVISLIFLAISPISGSTWCLFGQQIGRLLHSPEKVRLVNMLIALMIVASLALVILY